jgi:alpha-L-rhamnosidase
MLFSSVDTSGMQPSLVKQGVLKADKLMCEYKVNPLGIDVSAPRFGWTLMSSSQNEIQTAYEIIVSDNERDIQKEVGNVWTTGKVNSSDQINIVFTGKSLKPFVRYFWKVKTYDRAGEPSLWSNSAWFETAFINNTPWTAKWISDRVKQPERDEDHYKEDAMPLFRKEFEASKKVKAARLYVSGVGYYEAYINGKRVGENVLDPGWTTYAKQVQYTSYDITDHLASDKNVAGIMLGNGWWNPLPFKLFGRWDLRDYQQTGRPCVKAEIILTYSDGSTERIITDDSWFTTEGPVVRNNVYLGEHYDARREVAGWNKKGVILKSWKKSVMVDGPSGTLIAQAQPPIRITKVVKPVAISELRPGVFIVDMGQNFAGVARLKVKGRSGTTITLRYGEGLFDDGSLNVMTTVATQIKKGGIKGGPGAPETAWQEDSYTLNGKGVEIWSARFTFHGFRYLEINGWPGKPTVHDIDGLRMNSDLQQQGNFSCSNEMFNRLHDVIQWTFLSNVFSVQSDCPAREKMGYGADMVVSANAFIYNYDMATFYRKAITDFANEQRPLGGITEIAPFTGIDDRGYGDLSGPLGWQLAFPYLQQQLYDFYGDKRVIEENYAALQKQIEFLKSKAQNHLFYWDISDHESLDPRPEAFSASAFYFQHLLMASRFAGILNKKEDSVSYARLHQQVKKRITQQFLVPTTGRFDNATQSAQLFALGYDLAPDKEKSMKVLMNELERHQWHLSTGIFTTQLFFDVMRDNDLSEIAYRVANQRTFPGWGYMLEKGATTLWESWEFPETGPSRNHPMFGSIEEWFYRSLLGINSTAPGFAKIKLKPQPAGDLTWAKGSFESIRGRIVSDWKLSDGKFILQVTIPPNTTAEVWVPVHDKAVVLQNGKAIQNLTYEKGYAIVQTGSGKYTFMTDK